MDRRLIAGMVMASAAVLSAAGCGSDDKPKDGPEVAWAGKACGVLKQGAPLAIPKIESANVVQSKKSVVELLTGISTRMRTLETGLQGLGAPPVANGDALLQTAMRNLTRTHSTVTTAGKNLQKAKVTDAKSLQRAVGRVGQAFSQYNTYQGPQQDFQADPKLKAAFAKTPACQVKQG